MNILGVGGWELALILIIMLIVAGPKRMVRWAFVLGQYTAKLRQMWEETAGMLQKEFDEAGLDIEVPKTPPTRMNVNSTVRSQVDKALKPITQSIEETLREVDDVKKMSPAASNGHKAAQAKEEAPPQKPPPASAQGFGTWSGVNKDEGTNE
jgi:Sec-independent protein translocase protein TatA